MAIWQRWALDNFTDSESFKSKLKITQNAPADGNIKDIEIIVPLKYLSNVWRTLEMSLINCEVNLILTCSSTCVFTNSTGAGRFAIIDAKPFVPVITYQLKIMQKYFWFEKNN